MTKRVKSVKFHMEAMEAHVVVVDNRYRKYCNVL
jgi:hypothetical protein